MALVGICILGAILRFATLGHQSFDFDESFTAGIVLNGSLSHALHTIPLTESSPPLYYVLAWLWSRLFGLGEAGLRSLSAVLGAVLVPVAFGAARELGGRRAGLIAALLVAVNPLLVWYSQEARTYALLTLLSALSFWAFVRALERPTARSLAAWSVLSAAALLSHYFAGFLIAAEAAWLLLGTRRPGAVMATGAILAVAAALAPLASRQADHRTEWIESMSLASRIKEVVKKWVTGEIAPTRNWQLALAAGILMVALVPVVRSLGAEQRRGAVLAAGTGGGAVLLPLLVDLAGFHYLISKNVLPALTVLLITGGVVLGASRARVAGTIAALALALPFTALAVDDALNPALQRPDVRAATAALGPPVRDEVVLTPRGIDQPLILFRAGAATMPVRWRAREVVLVEPLPRADAASRAILTPAPPEGLRLAGRRDAHTFALICYRAAGPSPLSRSALLGIAGTQEGRNALVWPQARAGPTVSPCARR